MEPRITDRQRIALAGLSFFGDPFKEKGGWTEENEIGRLWKRFMAYLDGGQLALPETGETKVCYEVHIPHPETDVSGEYEIFVGIETENAERVPPLFLVKYLPACRYAVFTLQGQQIVSDWQESINSRWLPAAGYREAHGFSFQLYDERFKGMDRLEESSIDLYIPVQQINKG